ncbi:MAG: ABC transporter permease [Leptolyngbyaceae cyanobacterium bins.59]|nr:ABC transporter permease [Leptolyngbyaceae cyanobacterium bins.59]
MSSQIIPPTAATPPSEESCPLPKWLAPLILLGPSGLWLLLLLILPTLIIFQLSLVSGIRPGEKVIPDGLSNYALIFQPVYLLVMARSLFFAVGTTIICLLLGFPVAYWIAIQAPKRWQNLLLLGFVLPLWTSSLLRSYAWITILRPSGVLNTFIVNPLKPILNPLISLLNVLLGAVNWLLDTIAILDLANLLWVGLLNLPGPLQIPMIPLLPWNLLNQWPAVLIGMSYGLLPYMVLILYSSLEKLDKRLLEAAADLGASAQQAFWRVTVPQALPGIAAGSALVLITSLGDFVDPELLGGASSMTASRLIYNQFLGATQNWGFGSALSMVLILAVSITIALVIRLGGAKTLTEE